MKNVLFYGFFLIVVPLVVGTTPGFLVYKYLHRSPVEPQPAIVEDSEKKILLKVNFTRTKLIRTDLEKSGNKTLSMFAITLTFEKKLFAELVKDIDPVNGTAWKQSVRLIRDYINRSKLYEDYWIFIKKDKLIIVPLVGQKDCDEVVNDLLDTIQKTYHIELDEIDQK